VPENLIANRDLLGADVNPVLPKVLTSAYEQIRPTPTGGRVMTDDRAPTELMTDMLVVNFVLSGGSELPCQ
jgi:hypothetical protein